MKNRTLYAAVFVIAAFSMLHLAVMPAECSVASFNNKLISAPLDGRLYNFRVSRALENGWPAEFTGTPASGLSVCEYDDDINTIEYALFLKNGDKYELAILSEDGKRLNSENSFDLTISSAPVVIKTDLHQWTLFTGSTDGNIYTSPLNNISAESKLMTIDDSSPIYLIACDTDSHGPQEIIALSEKGSLKLLSYRASSWEAISTLDIKDVVTASPVMLDIAKDGKDELLVPLKGGILKAYSVVSNVISEMPWSANVGEDISATYTSNGNIICVTDNNIIILDGSGTVVKKIGNTSVLGTDYIVYSAVKGIVTESGPFHHIDQPEDPEFYKMPVYYSPNGDGIKDIADIPDEFKPV
jgi:hypothetical protein